MRQRGATAHAHSKILPRVLRSQELPARTALARAASLLHRNSAHYLASALLQLRLCERHMGKGLSHSRAALREAIANVQAALHSVRATIRVLRSPHGGFPGIEPYFLTAVAELQRPGTEFSVEIADVEPLPYAVEHALAIAGCEALTNAARHAAAQHIAIRLMQRGGAVILDVVDDGRGFDHRSARQCHRGVGLALMEEQVRSIGGQLRISRRPHGGTLVRATVHHRQHASALHPNALAHPSHGQTGGLW